MFRAGLRKILRQTVKGGVELPKILKDKLLRAGWGGIAENTWTSRGQSSDCQLANLWIGEVETNCRIVFCLVNPPTIKIPDPQYIATKHFLELAAKLFALQIPIAFHDLGTSSLHWFCIRIFQDMYMVFCVWMTL